MSPDRSNQPGLDVFWEQADDESNDEHPLERELVHRLEALTRYTDMIADAEAGGYGGMVEPLRRQRDRQQALVSALRDALRRRV